MKLFYAARFGASVAALLGLFWVSYPGVSHAQPPPPKPPDLTQGPPKLPPELQKISDAYAKAVKLHKDKQYPEALAAYEDFIKQATAAKAAPGALIAAYTNMAMIYLANNDQKHYAEILHHLISLDPKNSRALAQLAIIESADHHYDAALAYADRALALTPAKEVASSAHFVKGTAAVNHQDFKTAAREFGESAVLVPGNVMAHFNCGLALAELKKYDQAKVQLATAKRLDPNNQRINEYYDKLNNYLTALHNGGAVQQGTAYDAALKKDPHDPKALLGRAETLDKMGRVPDAISAYLAVIAVTPGSFDAHYNVARLYGISRNYPPSKEHFRKAEDIATAGKDVTKQAASLEGLSDAELQEGLSLADYRQRNQDLASAETHIKQGIALLPKDLRLKSRLGRIYDGQGRFKDEADLYREMLAASPDNLEYYARLANTYKSRADVEAFVGVWKEYQSHKPNDPTSYQYIADMYEMVKKYDKAMEARKDLLKRQISNSDLANARRGIGQDLVELKRFDEAREEFKAVLNMQPSQLGQKYMLQEKSALDTEQRIALKALAGLAGRDNKTDEAIGYLSELKKREAEIAKASSRPIDNEVYKDIATLYERSKRLDLAIGEYQSLVKALPNDPSPHDELGRIYESQNKIEAAAAEYNRAADLDTANPALHRMKTADMYQRNHMLDKAIAVLDGLHTKFPANIEVMTSLGQVYRQTGQDAKALAIYDAIVAVNPAFTWVQDNRAECLIRLNRYPEAEDVYVKQIDRNPAAGRQTYASLQHLYQLENHPEKFMTFLKPRFEKTPANTTAMAVLYDEFVRLGQEKAGQDYIMGIINKLTFTRRICLESYANQLQTHKHNTESLDVYRMVAKENAGDLTAWTNLVAQLDFNSKPDEGNEIYIAQSARKDISDANRAALQRTLAMRYAQQNKNTEARAAFQAIFDKNNRDYDAAMRLGDLVEKTGSTDEAVAFYHKLAGIAVYPLMVKVDISDRIANVYKKANKKDEAAAQYRESLKLDPQDPIALGAVKRLQGG